LSSRSRLPHLCFPMFSCLLFIQNPSFQLVLLSSFSTGKHREKKYGSDVASQEYHRGEEMGTNMGCFSGRAKKGELSCSSNDGGVCDTIPTPGCINDNGRAPEWIVAVRGFNGYLFHQCHWLQSPGKFKPSLLYFYSLYILQLFFIWFILYIENPASLFDMYVENQLFFIM